GSRGSGARAAWGVPRAVGSLGVNMVLDPELVGVGRRRERELVQEFGVHGGALRSEARGDRLADTVHVDKVIAHNDRAGRDVPSRLPSPGSKHAGKNQKGAADLLSVTEWGKYRSLGDRWRMA
ncbi:unnamed protein product, partial [Prorocentrum cordatum]